MKKTFLVKRNALLSFTYIPWSGFALIIVISLFLVRFFAPNLFWQILAPVFHGADSLATESHAFFSGFGNNTKLSLQNENLVNENIALANENQTLLQKEASLEALLGLSVSGKNTTSKILAGVIAHPPEIPYDTLVLAAGFRAGIALGQEVFGAGDVPIGIISAVFADFSRATLFSSPGVRVSGWVGPTDIPLTITGSGAGTMKATLPRSVSVAIGDTVFGPGPGMLPLGKVTRIDGNPTAPSVTLRITPALNLFSVSWVIVRGASTALLNALSQATSTLP